MSLRPAFQIGLWNAWIFMLYDLLAVPFFVRIARSRGPVSPAESALSKTERIIFFSSHAIFFASLIYSVFLPLRLETMWFYVGLPIALIGLVTRTIVFANWATTPRDEPVTKGLYRYSRHPMYLTAFLYYVGVSIASASWLLLLLLIVYTVGLLIVGEREEQGCLEKYGDTYREYMNRTPKWIGIPKSEEE